MCSWKRLRADFGFALAARSGTPACNAAVAHLVSIVAHGLREAGASRL
jgi:hypothetical protein